MEYAALAFPQSTEDLVNKTTPGLPGDAGSFLPCIKIQAFENFPLCRQWGTVISSISCIHQSAHAGGQPRDLQPSATAVLH